VIASHYAEPLQRQLTHPAPLLAAPEEDAAQLVQLAAGDLLLMLDNSRGWAWGYAGGERRVGYIRGEALGA
jgi:hypothetical protein